jgi:hypothetical protein
MVNCRGGAFMSLLKYEVESCGCCWHITILDNFGFGRKDHTFYVLVFGNTLWLRFLP